MRSTHTSKPAKGIQIFRVQHVTADSCVAEDDHIIMEAPLEINVAYGKTDSRRKELIAVTMRTPGDDFNLVTGWLFSEQIIQRATDILSIRFIGNFEEEALQENALLVELSPDLQVELTSIRKFMTNSACGYCGKGTFDVTSAGVNLIPAYNPEKISLETLYHLPSRIHALQGLFDSTGGSHAVALFSLNGSLLQSAEDVGRHNAMDKMIGRMLKQGALPLSGCIAMFSGRLSYELVHKSLCAGIPVLCSIGAPTSLALELASDYNLTIIGFLRKERLNIYCGAERIALEKTSLTS